jgi:hypothetical protein
MPRSSGESIVAKKKKKDDSCLDTKDAVLQ